MVGRVVAGVLSIALLSSAVPVGAEGPMTPLRPLLPSKAHPQTAVETPATPEPALTSTLVPTIVVSTPAPIKADAAPPAVAHAPVDAKSPPSAAENQPSQQAGRSPPLPLRHQRAAARSYYVRYSRGWSGMSYGAGFGPAPSSSSSGN